MAESFTPISPNTKGHSFGSVTSCQSFIHQGDTYILRQGPDQIKDYEITPEQLQSLLDKARAQAESGRSKVQDSAETSRANNTVISEMVAAFLIFLRNLLWYIGTPLAIHAMLDSLLDQNAVTLQGVIASDKEIASGLLQEGESARRTLNDLKKAQDFIQDQREGPAQKIGTQPLNSDEVQLLDALRYVKMEEEKEKKEKEEKEQQRRATEEAERIQWQKDKYAKLEEQVPRLEKGIEELQQTVEQLKAQRDETEAKVARLEANQEEAERIRRENEGKTVWQKIWAWIRWLSSCGNYS